MTLPNYYCCYFYFIEKPFQICLSTKYKEHVITCENWQITKLVYAHVQWLSNKLSDFYQKTKGLSVGRKNLLLLINVALKYMPSLFNGFLAKHTLIQLISRSWVLRFFLSSCFGSVFTTVCKPNWINFLYICTYNKSFITNKLKPTFTFHFF